MALIVLTYGFLNLPEHEYIFTIHPEYEKHGNYVPSILPLRYDAFIFIDETKGLHPLHIVPDGHLIPETYPFGE